VGIEVWADLRGGVTLGTEEFVAGGPAETWGAV